MNRAKLIVLLVCCAGILLSCSSRLSTDEFLEHRNAGDSAYNKGDYLEAEKHYKAALVVAEKQSPNNSQVQTALHYLGVNYVAQGKYAEAEATYKRQINVAETVYGAESPDLLSPLSDITLLFIKQGRFDAAGQYNQRALSIISKIPKGEHKEAVELTESLRDWIQKGKSS